jgi:two-component system chemotaxis response regulator CheV
MVTAVTHFPKGELALMLNVERVLSELNQQTEEHEASFHGRSKIDMKQEGIFFLRRLGGGPKTNTAHLGQLFYPLPQAINGKEAWESIQRIVDANKNHGEPLSIRLILTDIEMPEMDGYSLTKLLKADPRTRDIAVVMHSSLSGDQNQALRKNVGAKYYIPKFKPDELVKAFKHFLA